MPGMQKDTRDVVLGGADVFVFTLFLVVMKQSEPFESIDVRPVTKRNGFTLSAFGVLGLLLSLVLATLLPPQYQLLVVFSLSLSFVALLIGWFKVRQPATSVRLTRQTLCYSHQKGSWELAWSNIQRMGIPSIRQGVDYQDLPLIGFKIKDYEVLLDNISPRLASNLLIQQRALLLYEESCQSGLCYSEALLEEDSYKSDSGKVYKGILAMFAHRMHRVRQILGYDLFIDQSDLDRSEEEFLALLKDCQRFASD